MRLGGWVPVWIVGCVLYGLVVAYFSEWALATNTVGQVTDTELRRELSDQQIRLVHKREQSDEPVTELHMSDGSIFFVSRSASIVELRQAWKRASDRKQQRGRIKIILGAGLIWLVPCLAPFTLFALGPAIAWVRRRGHASNANDLDQ